MIYPFDCFLRDGYQDSEDDGIETMVAIDGSLKTHVMYATGVHMITGRHKLNKMEYEQLMRFYQYGKGVTFSMKHPLTDVDLIARFTAAPKLITRIEDELFIVEVKLGANVKEVD